VRVVIVDPWVVLAVPGDKRVARLVVDLPGPQRRVRGVAREQQAQVALGLGAIAGVIAAGPAPDSAGRKRVVFAIEDLERVKG
jgi:hypothetical protein